jgi:hypothetical protein
MAQSVFPLTGDISFFSKTHATFIARMIIIWRFFMPNIARIQVTSTTDLTIFIRSRVCFIFKSKNIIAFNKYTTKLEHTYKLIWAPEIFIGTANYGSNFLLHLKS